MRWIDRPKFVSTFSRAHTLPLALWPSLPPASAAVHYVLSARGPRPASQHSRPLVVFHCPPAGALGVLGLTFRTQFHAPSATSPRDDQPSSSPASAQASPAARARTS